MDAFLHLRIEPACDPAGQLHSQDRVGAEIDLAGASAVTLADVAAIDQAAGVLIDRP